MQSEKKPKPQRPNRTAAKEKRGALSVYESLKDDILWARIAPGTPLDEVSLAERFAVSRTPIREALLLLASEKLVTFMVNRTTVVAPFDLGNLGKYLDVYALLCRLAVASADPGGIDRASAADLLSEQARSVRNGDKPGFLIARKAILQKIARSSRNLFLSRYLDDALDSGHRAMVLVYLPNASDNELISAVEKFEALVGAVLDRDGSCANQLMTEIIQDELAVQSRQLDAQFGFDMGLMI